MAAVPAAGGPRQYERVRGGGPGRVRGERDGSVRGCCIFWGGARLLLATARALVGTPPTLTPPRRGARRRRGWRRGRRVRSSCGRAALAERQGGFIGGIGRETERGGQGGGARGVISAWRRADAAVLGGRGDSGGCRHGTNREMERCAGPAARWCLRGVLPVTSPR